MAKETIGDGAIEVIHEGYADNRACYRYTVTVGEQVHTAQDLRSGCGQEENEEEMLRTLCSFLVAAADAYQVEMDGRISDNGDMFPPFVNEWAYQNSDELASASMDENE